MAYSNLIGVRDLSNFTDLLATERNVYITAKNMHGWNDPSLSSTSFRFAFLVCHTTRSDTDPTSGTRMRSSYLFIQYPFERFASADEAKAVVTRMLTSDPRFPFYLIDRRIGQSLLWEELPAYDDGSSSSAVEQVPMQRLDDMIIRISEAAVRIARQASESGRNVACMLIKIDKRMVVRHQEFEMVRILMNHAYDEDDDEDVTNGDDDDDDDDDESEDEDPDDDDDDEPELNRAIEQSFAESAMAFGSVPAAKSVVEAWEKFKHEGSCKDHEDELKLIQTCVICMEEVMIGSQLTRMPCSHIFHGECISKWLRLNHTCPLCRFKLLSQ